MSDYGGSVPGQGERCDENLRRFLHSEPKHGCFINDVHVHAEGKRLPLGRPGCCGEPGIEVHLEV